MPLRTRKRGVLLVVALTAGVALFMFLRRSGKAEVQFTVAKMEDVFETVLATGKVAGSTVVPLSLQGSGVVARIIAGEGRTVARGDTLLALDNQEQRNAVVQRQNAVQAARLSLEKLGNFDAATAQEQLRSEEHTS